MISRWIKSRDCVRHSGRGLSIRKWQKSFAHYIFTKSESHQRSLSHIAAPMMVLYRAWANESGAKRPDWNANFAWIFCSDCKKRPLNPCNFLIERPPWIVSSHWTQLDRPIWLMNFIGVAIWNRKTSSTHVVLLFIFVANNNKYLSILWVIIPAVNKQRQCFVGFLLLNKGNRWVWKKGLLSS